MNETKHYTFYNEKGELMRIIIQNNNIQSINQLIFIIKQILKKEKIEKIE